MNEELERIIVQAVELRASHDALLAALKEIMQIVKNKENTEYITQIASAAIAKAEATK